MYILLKVVYGLKLYIYNRNIKKININYSNVKCISININKL